MAPDVFGGRSLVRSDWYLHVSVWETLQELIEVSGIRICFLHSVAFQILNSISVELE